MSILSVTRQFPSKYHLNRATSLMPSVSTGMQNINKNKNRSSWDITFFCSAQPFNAHMTMFDPNVHWTTTKHHFRKMRCCHMASLSRFGVLENRFFFFFQIDRCGADKSRWAETKKNTTPCTNQWCTLYERVFPCSTINCYSNYSSYWFKTIFPFIDLYCEKTR